MMVNKLIWLVGLWSSLLLLGVAVDAQGIKFGDDLDQDGGCEMTSKVIEDVFRDALRDGERIFIISRGGVNEKRSTAVRRLDEIEKRFGLVPQRPPMTFAQGKATLNGRGLVEFWVGSTPRAVIQFAKEERFCIDTPSRSDQRN